MSIILMSIALLCFAILHSLLARLPVKEWVRNRVGHRTYEGFYRIAYTIAAVITLLPTAIVLLIAPSNPVWQVEGVWVVVFRLVQLTGVAGLTASLLQIDLGRFAGTAQLRAYFDGQPLPLPPETLKTDGIYGFVRHPLYFFSLLLLWFTPSMTATFLAFVVITTLYFIVGSLLEEHTMEKIFGSEYKDYQQVVPWMIPFVRLPVSE